MDCKTILERLSECSEDQERHSQIAFADKILLNKLDLVTDQEVASVWHRIRSYNANAPVVPSVKGIVPASELTGIGAYDLDAQRFSGRFGCFPHLNHLNPLQILFFTGSESTEERIEEEERPAEHGPDAYDRSPHTNSEVFSCVFMWIKHDLAMDIAYIALKCLK